MIFDHVSIPVYTAYLFFTVSLAILCGCVSTARISSLPASVEETDWVVSGKIAVQLEKQRESGSFIWRQQGAASDIVLIDPFGRIVANLHADSSDLRIEVAERYQTDPSLLQTLRDSLPVVMMSYWILGRPAPTAAHEFIVDAQGVMTSIRQQDWLIEYLVYRGDKVRKMRVSRPPMSLVMVLSDWHQEVND